MIIQKLLKHMEETIFYAKAVDKIIEYEQAHLYDPGFWQTGWHPSDVDTPDWVIYNLYIFGYVKLNPAEGYITANHINVRDTLELYRVRHPPMKALAPNLFDDIIGFEDLKERIYLNLSQSIDVNWLFSGVPASAKTLFLMALESLEGARMIFGSRTTRAGLVDFMLNEQPRYLLIDEIDKMTPAAMSPLLGLAEDGRLVSTLHGKHIDERFEITVFASANRLFKIPEEVQSRFELSWFPEYTGPEFMEVCEGLLPRHGADPFTARYIGDIVFTQLGGDIRQAIRVCKMAKDKAAVDQVVSTLVNYKPGRGD